MTEPEPKTFDLIFQSRASARGKMRNDINVTWPAMGESFDLPTDEGGFHGGDGTAPPPLAYFTAALTGCVMTQIRAFAKRLKIEVEALDLQVNLHWRGEQKGQEPYQSMPVGFQIDIRLESPQSVEERINLIEHAILGCFIEQSLSKEFEVIHRLWVEDHWITI